MSERIDQASALIRAGFDPAESLAALGLPPLKHLGLPPVTVQMAPEPEPEPTPPALPPAPGGQEPPEPEPEDDERAARAERALLLDVASRYVRREAYHVRRAAKDRGALSFEAGLTRFYAAEEDKLRQFLEPAVGFVLARRSAAASAAQVADELARAYVERSREALASLPAGLNLEDAVERLVARWETTRAAELADELAGVGAYSSAA